MKKATFLLTAVILFCSWIPSNAQLVLKIVNGQDLQQDVIAAAGDHFESGDVSVSWTLGEVVIGTLESEEHILTQGFQQGDLSISNLVEQSELGFIIEAFPNPVQDKLTVKFDKEKLSYQVVDILGKIHLNGTIYNGSGTIDFADQKEGIYFLVVDHRRTHKIVKK
jgi:hypothetical protein